MLSTRKIRIFFKVTKEVEIILLYAYYAINSNLIDNETLFIRSFIT